MGLIDNVIEFSSKPLHPPDGALNLFDSCTKSFDEDILTASHLVIKANMSYMEHLLSTQVPSPSTKTIFYVDTVYIQKPICDQGLNLFKDCINVIPFDIAINARRVVSEVNSLLIKSSGDFVPFEYFLTTSWKIQQTFYSLKLASFELVVPVDQDNENNWPYRNQFCNVTLHVDNVPMAPEMEDQIWQTYLNYLVNWNKSNDMAMLADLKNATKYYSKFQNIFYLTLKFKELVREMENKNVSQQYVPSWEILSKGTDVVDKILPILRTAKEIEKNLKLQGWLVEDKTEYKIGLTYLSKLSSNITLIPVYGITQWKKKFRRYLRIPQPWNGTDLIEIYEINNAFSESLRRATEIVKNIPIILDIDQEISKATKQYPELYYALHKVNEGFNSLFSETNGKDSNDNNPYHFSHLMGKTITEFRNLEGNLNCNGTSYHALIYLGEQVFRHYEQDLTIGDSQMENLHWCITSSELTSVPGAISKKLKVYSLQFL